MTTEEIDFNERLEHHHLESVETDLGEYILQLKHERPYHIVAPALHLTRYDVANLFEKELGVANDTVIENQTMLARKVLRDKFLQADIGVSGANFLVADSGAVVLVENEGNARLTTSAPKIHIAVAGIEKVIPRAQDLATFLKLLGRSATGQPLTVYTSFLSGPRRGKEIDGPDEFYLVLLDNGRTKVLADEEKRQALYCIRCGACLNHCPVYRKIGGHSFPWVYSGPIGAILTPQFMGARHEPGLPFASSLCGACAEVCPVKIDIPKVLLDLREEVVQTRTEDASNQLERFAFRMFAFAMSPPEALPLGGKDGGNVWAEGGLGKPCARARDVAARQDVAEPAGSSVAREEEFPRSMEGEEGLMAHRELMLREIRTALRRRQGQPIPPPPPVRLVVPNVPVAQRIESMLERVAALAGKTLRAQSKAEAREYVASVITGKTAVASNAPFLQDCGITRLPGVHSGIDDREELRALCATVDYGISSADYATVGHRLAGHDCESGRSSPDFAAATSPYCRGSGFEAPDRPRRTLYHSAQTGRSRQFHGPDHWSQPDSRYRANHGARRTRPWGDSRRSRGRRIG